MVCVGVADGGWDRANGYGGLPIAQKRQNGLGDLIPHGTEDSHAFGFAAHCLGGIGKRGGILLTKLIPLNRLGRPKMWPTLLPSDNAQFVTGHTLIIDGGPASGDGRKLNAYPPG